MWTNKFCQKIIFDSNNLGNNINIFGYGPATCIKEIAQFLKKLGQVRNFVIRKRFGGLLI